MTAIKMTWKTEEQRLGGPIDVLRVGRIKVGTVSFAVQSRSDPAAYSYACRLPGLKEDFLSGQRPTEEEAKVQLVQVVLSWFRYAGIGDNNGGPKL